jgi:hypothetical protein
VNDAKCVKKLVGRKLEQVWGERTQNSPLQPFLLQPMSPLFGNLFEFLFVALAQQSEVFWYF